MALSDKELDQLTEDYLAHVYTRGQNTVTFSFKSRRVRVSQNIIAFWKILGVFPDLKIKIKSYKQVKKLLAFYL